LIGRKSTVTSTQPKPFVFVLMPFDASFNDIYKFGIKGAADDVGAYAERVDEQMYSGSILDRILNQISKADVIVADMTRRNPNVFYEVGYAHALGKVVLLLTQNADDIPFDLKHRAHTVYEGKIDTLRTTLVSKLQWAISESRKLQQPGGMEQLSIRLYGLEIPRCDASSSFDPEKLPTVKAITRSRSFRLPIHLRNDSPEAMVAITHVYLFSAKGAPLIPCEYQTTSYPFINGVIYNQSNIPGSYYQEPYEMDSFTASSVDAPDGLNDQFRIKASFASVPPGAVEESSLDLLFRKDQASCNGIYRLRLHSARQFYDFRFRLAIEHEQNSTTKVQSTAAEKGQ
jgi:hypothetical protein